MVFSVFLSVYLQECKKQRHTHKKNDKPMPIVSARSQPIPVGSARPRVQIRSRTMSMSSTGSSPPSSASPNGSPTQTRPVGRSDVKFEFALTSEQASSGMQKGLFCCLPTIMW